MSGNQYNGFLAVFKPTGISSHGLVQKVRKICDLKRVGHTGTLDPGAEGLLVLCLGRTTKLAGYISGSDKSYRAVVRLGLATDSYDAENVDANSPFETVPSLTDADIKEVLKSFVGTIKQRVPAYSAVQVNGRRLYEMARKGEEVDPPEREITINGITLITYNKPHITIEIDCGKGTYIRSLAHDIGQKIGCGAHLASLRRTSVGEITDSRAMTLEEIESRHIDNTLEEAFLPVDSVLGFQSITVADRFRASLSNGRQPTPNDITHFDGFRAGERVLLRDSDGGVLAIGRATMHSEQLAENSVLPVIDFDRVLI